MRRLAKENFAVSRCRHLAEQDAGVALPSTRPGGARLSNGRKTMTTSCVEFERKKVLVVESEFLMPFALYRAMEELGAQVIGPVGFPDDMALVLEGNCPDGVIVDSRLEATDRKVIHRMLRRMHVPF